MPHIDMQDFFVCTTMAATAKKVNKLLIFLWTQVINPYLGGIGLGSAVISIVVGCYYNVIIAWCIYYLANSFRVSQRCMPSIGSLNTYTLTC